ncbi:MAG TPA: TetR family transcriptional regulator [Candidatus Binatia bacterium]|nr:TetR family transcriptional regulator [Candidatus Binatia bacterium]
MASPELVSGVSREPRGLRTRVLLQQAALRLMGQGRGFTSLGLREVSREAGIAPAGFYRHFRDMDELGLALVEEGGRALRQLLREARSGLPNDDMIRRSVKIYRDYIAHHRLEMLFIVGERSGGSRVVRDGVRREISHFVTDMAHDLRQLNFLPALSTPALQMVCGLVVNTMLFAASDILDLPPQQPRAEAELIGDFVRQLRVIFLGAQRWRDDIPAAA